MEWRQPKELTKFQIGQVVGGADLAEDGSEVYAGGTPSSVECHDPSDTARTLLQLLLKSIRSGRISSQ